MTLAEQFIDAADKLNSWWMESGALDNGSISNAIQMLDMAAIMTAAKKAS